MTLALGIFDVFTYAIPGSLYLGLFTYLAARWGWLRVGAADLDTTALLIGAALASYLLGHVTYELGRAVRRLVPWREPALAAARAEFLARVPDPRAAELVKLDPQLLLAAIEVSAKEAGVEVSRLRAVGLMLQNLAPVLLLGALVAVVEAVLGPHRAGPAACAALLVGGALAAARRGRELERWSLIKTHEVAFWVTGPADPVARPR